MRKVGRRGWMSKRKQEEKEGGDDLRAACCNLPRTPVGFTY